MVNSGNKKSKFKKNPVLTEDSNNFSLPKIKFIDNVEQERRSVQPKPSNGLDKSLPTNEYLMMS